IVVLENIFRLRQSGQSQFDAALRGATQVWGAVLVSALTTVVVFAPILVMDLVVGQLFRDIAVALSVAVLLSLVVSITVIPTLASRLLGEGVVEASLRRRIPIVDDAARLFMAGVTAFARHVVMRRSLALLTVLIVCGVTGFATWMFLPRLEYLPEGNRNQVIAITQPPPGYNLETSLGIAEKVEAATREHWASETGPESVPGAPPKMERFWFIARGAANIVSASAVDPTRAGELIPMLRQAAFAEPGTFGFVSQTSLFGRGLGGGRVIDLDITGPDLEVLLSVARDVVNRIGRAMPASAGNQVRPRPGLELGSPEVRVVPDLIRLGDVGLNARDLGLAIDAFNDGMRATEVTVDGRRMDLTLTGPENRISRTQGIDNLPVVTRTGTILPARALATIEVTEGPTEILHLERERTIHVQVRPSTAVPLETAIETLNREIIEPLVEAGLPGGVRLSLSGTADELHKTWDAMVVNLVVAVLIVYLVMAVLLESFVYPLIILFSVPLAT
ncbi:MAG TPA: efflux RND transporter permease subunit, partial [Rhodospirillales bacterium]|nr:efflux RND transporter permease subunit [Rhodospirillales bacterium]